MGAGFGFGLGSSCVVESSGFDRAESFALVAVSFDCIVFGKLSGMVTKPGSLS